MARVTLKKGREESVIRRHPWIYSGAVHSLHGSPGPGEPVDVYSHDGTWLATATWSPRSQIKLRIWSFDKDRPIERDLLEERIDKSISVRTGLACARQSTAYRIVNSEADLLPGLIVDKYGDHLVCQFLSTGAEYFRETILDILEDRLHPRGIYERSDTDARSKEGLAPKKGRVRGGEPPKLIEIQEHEVRFLVDIREGHKTGFYLDQRDNRLALKDFAAGCEVLNCFSYTGAFGIAACRAGAAQVVNVDTSEAALTLARENALINGIPGESFEAIEADAFACLREFRDRGRTFDLIVLDPPKFAPSASLVPRAARGYKDINLLAFKLLRPGGVLFTFSCSGHVSPALFQKIVSDAALDAGRDALIVKYLGQAPDHPIGISFPEGLYLKGLICMVL